MQTNPQNRLCCSHVRQSATTAGAPPSWASLQPAALGYHPVGACLGLRHRPLDALSARTKRRQRKPYVLPSALHYLRDATLAFPLVLAATWAGLWLTRRWHPHGGRGHRAWC